MQINVNEKPIDFEMTEVLPLPRILGHIGDWAKEDDLYILDYNVVTTDGKNHSHSVLNEDAASSLSAQIQTGELDSIDSDSIESLNVTIGKKEDLLVEHILELESYIEKIGNFLAMAIASGNPVSDRDEEDVADGIFWIRESFSLLLKRYPMQTENLNLFFDIQPKDINSHKEALLDSLIRVRSFVQLWKKNVFLDAMNHEEMIEYRDHFLVQIETAIENLETIIQDLTAGKEASAFNGFESFMEWASFGLAVLDKLEFQPSLLAEIRGVLGEVEEALNRKDFVTLTDILDFDLREKLEELSAGRDA